MLKSPASRSRAVWCGGERRDGRRAEMGGMGSRRGGHDLFWDLLGPGERVLRLFLSTSDDLVSRVAHKTHH